MFSRQTAFSCGCGGHNTISAHWWIMVMERLQQLFLDPIILLGRDHKWLLGSLDLTPLDFFV